MYKPKIYLKELNKSHRLFPITRFLRSNHYILHYLTAKYSAELMFRRLHRNPSHSITIKTNDTETLTHILSS